MRRKAKKRRYFCGAGVPDPFECENFQWTGNLGNEGIIVGGSELTNEDANKQISDIVERRKQKDIDGRAKRKKERFLKDLGSKGSPIIPLPDGIYQCFECCMGWEQRRGYFYIDDHEDDRLRLLLDQQDKR